MLSKWISRIGWFVLGLCAGAIASLISVSNNHTETLKDPCEARIDRALGLAILDKVSILRMVSQLVSSNENAAAQSILNDHLWWELESAWQINAKHAGVLDRPLRQAIVDDYPRLKIQVDLARFAKWPRRALIEMTNFIFGADMVIQSNGVAPTSPEAPRLQ